MVEEMRRSCLDDQAELPGLRSAEGSHEPGVPLLRRGAYRCLDATRSDWEDPRLDLVYGSQRPIVSQKPKYPGRPGGGISPASSTVHDAGPSVLWGLKPIMGHDGVAEVMRDHPASVCAESPNRPDPGTS